MVSIEQLWELHDTALLQLDQALTACENFDDGTATHFHTARELVLMEYVVSDLEEKIQKRLRDDGYLPVVAPFEHKLTCLN